VLAIILNAVVRAQRGTTRHLGVGDVGEVTRLVIKEDGGLFFLQRYDARDRFAGDTCHLTLYEARTQAEYEYELLGGWTTGRR